MGPTFGPGIGSGIGWLIPLGGGGIPIPNSG